MLDRFRRFLWLTFLVGVLMFIFVPVGGAVVAGLLFPVLLIIGLPLYLLLALGSAVGKRARR